MSLLDIKLNINEGTAKIHTDYQTKKKLKLKVSNGDSSIVYNIIPNLIIPLTFHSGTYRFILYEQVRGNTYAEKTRIYKPVHIKDNAYTLSSNTYVPFNEQSSFYKQALELKTLKQIYEYFLKYFQYDYIEAALTANKSFTPPDIEMCFQKKMGTCYNLSALFAAMLRICGIPTKLIVGKAEKNAHAWIEVQGKRYDIAAKLSHQKVNKYQAERYY